jgi:IPT/TIG domain-containing protein
VKRTSHILVFLCMSLLLALGVRAQSSAPNISSIPDIVATGQTITIKGRNFSTNKADNIVQFGSLQATVTKAKKKKLFVTVPDTLPPGETVVTVTVAGLSSNSVQVRVLASVTPLAGEFVGETQQNVIFRLRVQENRQVVTDVRTSFTCAATNCAAGASINSRQFGELDHGFFDIEMASSQVTAKIEGRFTSETRAEGTIEFTIRGQCNCETGKLKWTATLD